MLFRSPRTALLRRSLLLAVLLASSSSVPGRSVPSGQDAEEWRHVPVPAPFSRISGLEDFDGIVWYRTYVVVPESWAGDPLTLHLGTIDDADETYINGVKIGGLGGFGDAVGSAYGTPRVYEVPAERILVGRPNLIAVRVRDAGGEGGITAGPLALKGPKGTIGLGGGTWLLREGDRPAAEWDAPATSFAALILAREYLGRQGSGAIAAGNPVVITAAEAAPEGSRILWYREPASSWLEALPVGNGRLGAMVHGGVRTMHLQLNEESVWAGLPIERDRPGSAEAFREARELCLEGRIAEAQRLLQDEFMTPRRIRSHQTLGDLRFELADLGVVDDYQRSLDLSTGITRTRFRSGEARFTREVFASAPDDALILRLTCDRPGGLSGRLTLDRPEGASAGVLPPDQLRLVGRASQGGEDPGTSFEARARLTTIGGGIRSEAGVIEVRGADEILIVLAAATDFRKGDPGLRNERVLGAAAERTFEELRQRHVADHQALLRRVTLELGGHDRRSLPTNERLARVRAGESDPDLIATWFQYGRYLLMGSSRPGTLPANLQGIWNPHIEAPWNADYHLNINLQMNYWPAEVTALSECHEPLFDFIRRLRLRGVKTARVHYGAPGWVAHHVSDIWAFTVPIGLTVWGLWPHGGTWLCRHLWEHYQFTGDRTFLEEQAWPAVEGACRFQLAMLVEEPDTGLLISGPSSSPENSYRLDDGTVVDVGMGNTSDQVLIADLFDIALEMGEILSKRTTLLDEVREARARLAAPAIGEGGALLEWRGPMEEAQPGHIHTAHLIGLHPAELWTPERDTARFIAARKSLERRLASGGGHTGWSRAWLASQFARLGDGAAVQEHLQFLLAQRTEPNLLNTHPPFQIDGNLGGTAGVAEALVQSHGGVLRLLPALPPAWTSGSVTGLRTRQGLTVDLRWAEGALIEARLTASRAVKVPVVLGGDRREIELSEGGSMVLTP
jgi:alpha-L-fucosidase 2